MGRETSAWTGPGGVSVLPSTPNQKHTPHKASRGPFSDRESVGPQSFVMPTPSPSPSRWDRFKARSTTVWLHVWRWEPPWLFREIVIVGLVSAAVVYATTAVDDRRAETDRTIAAEQNKRAERLENLRFVRERSNPDPNTLRPFAGLDLEGAILTGLELPGADLAHANLLETDLARANLTGAMFFNARLTRAWLVGANLTGADLGGAIAPAAEFHRANLTGARLGAHLAGANFMKANLRGADFGSYADATDADFRGADLSGADLRGAELAGANWYEVCWDASTLWPTDVSPPSSARECSAA